MKLEVKVFKAVVFKIWTIGSPITVGDSEDIKEQRLLISLIFRRIKVDQRVIESNSPN